MSQVFIGLMSGTSLDGIDAVVADFSTTPRLLAAHACALPQDLRRTLLALNQPQFDDLRLAQEASVALAEHYATASLTVLAQAGLPASAIRAIACHGQTVRHRPENGYSVQLNHPARLAERTGITVVADFRNRDIAAGGQGAPLVPAFHQAILADPQRHRVILNLGGIANLTQLKPGAAVFGFDTGPANALLDGWCERHQGQPFDANGAWAASGSVLPELLARLLAHPFFTQTPPKSCGREEFSLAWVDAFLQGDEAIADVQATLAALTAQSAAQAIRRDCGEPQEVLLCGGGAHNQNLRQRLAAALPNSQIACTDDYAVPGDYLEAFAFAWLGYRLMNGHSGNLPAVTGARGERLLGAIYPA